MKRLLLLALWAMLSTLAAGAQMPTQIWTNGNPVSDSNQFPVSTEVTVSGITTLDTLTTITNPVPLLGTNGTTVMSGLNPLSITGSVEVTSGGGFELVGVKGTDGATITSLLNPLPVAPQGTTDINPIWTGGNPFIMGFLPSGGSPSSTAIVTYSTPFPIIHQDGSGVESAMPVSLAAITNPVGVLGTSGAAITSPTNPLDVRPSADGTNPVDATHGLYTNLLQSNAVNSGTNPIFADNGGVAQGDIVNTNTAIPDSSTQVTLGTACRHIRIRVNSAAVTLYVDLTDNTATSADYAIEPGDELVYDGGAAITAFKVIGSAAADTYNVLAW